jgi:hypothetical protein
MNSLTAMYLWFSTMTGPGPDPIPFMPGDFPSLADEDDTGDSGEPNELGPKPINNGY